MLIVIEAETTEWPLTMAVLHPLKYTINIIKVKQISVWYVCYRVRRYWDKKCWDNLKRLCGINVSYKIITINVLLLFFSCMTFFVTYNNIIINVYMRFSWWNDCKMRNASDQSSYRDYTVNIIIGIKMKEPKVVDSQCDSNGILSSTQSPGRMPRRIIHLFY